MTAEATTTHIALGANVGDKLSTLRSALDALDQAPGVRATAVSALYETAPVGGPGGQDRFLNAAAALETTLAPLALLDLLQSVEAAHQRTREARWAPRTLDLDILFYGAQVVRSDRLILPHPRLSKRRFVLAPLADIAPALTHPALGASVAELLAALDPADEGDVVRIADDWRSA